MSYQDHWVALPGNVHYASTPAKVGEIRGPHWRGVGALLQTGFPVSSLDQPVCKM